MTATRLTSSQRPPLSRHTLALVAILGLLAILVPRAARAEDPIVGLRSLAMGDSLRAAATGAEGVLLNPSGIAILKQYAVTGFYGFRLETLGSAVHVSVTDSVTQARIAMGLYYNFTYDSPKVGYNVAEGTTTGGRVFNSRDAVFDPSGLWQKNLSHIGNEFGVITAFPLGDRFSLGVTTKYGYYSTSAQLPTALFDSPRVNFKPTNPAINGNLVYDLGSLSSVVSFDVGLTVHLPNGFGIGLVGQNLWGHGSEMPTLLAGGLAYVGGPFTISADASLNFTGNQVCNGPAVSPCSNTADRLVVRTGGGLEYSLANKVPVRVGYLYDTTLPSQYITGGIGYFNQSFALDFATRDRVDGGRETVLLLGFRIFRD